MYSYSSLEALFEPTSIAIIGATADQDDPGTIVASNLLASGYKGKIFPVNAEGEEVLGIKAFSSISEIPRFTDLAVICLSPAEVLGAVEMLCELPVRAAIVTSSGFGETGREGYILEQRLAKIAKKTGMIILGPNCLGLMNPTLSLNASLSADYTKQGNIAFFSQSGALCNTALDWANSEGVGFSKFISLGNKAVLSEATMLRYLSNDPDTKVVVGYCETLEDGQDFLRVAYDATCKKPLILLRAGGTSAGARAASAHSGALTGTTSAYNAAFRQAGVLQAVDIEDMFNLAHAFSCQPLPKGGSVAIVTNSGGPGIIAADMCEKGSLTVSRPSNATIDKMKGFLKPYAALYNPIDMIGDATSETYAKTLRAVIEDDAFDSVLVILTPAANIVAEVEKVAADILVAAMDSSKPIVTCFMGGHSVAGARNLLRDGGIPCYDFPEAAVRSLDAMTRCYRWQNKDWPIEVCFRRDISKAQSIVANSRRIGLMELVELDAQHLASAYELPVPETVLARTSNQAAKAAKRIGYPVVLKVASPQISRKEELGLVVTDLNTPQELRRAFLEITSRAARRCKDAYITGCLVQAMGPKDSHEVIISFRRDAQFGPLIRFSLGGIHADMLGDVSSRLAPLALNDAQEMIREIAAYPILRGARSGAAIDLGALEDILLMVSQMASDLPEIQEAEFSPIIVGPDGAVVANMRMTIG
ncbi:acetyltransferase [Maridesulfovibrio ferrireducens]|uniref:Acetyltransferase n=1 Tax=Maridesulfovibrio ferrireducens TaxID=246191 RepID=A0A1G9J6P5_9BACT|nr:acetate--CoA ligase [Maridesulfovibrio ferrireducens]SDL33189.1 acetyltransferase [Maridesulfovibrio ferrireducens]